MARANAVADLTALIAAGDRPGPARYVELLRYRRTSSGGIRPGRNGTCRPLLEPVSNNYEKRRELAHSDARFR